MQEDDESQTVPGFNWMVAILRKIITAGTGEKIESKMPPLLEFFRPEALQVRRYVLVNLMKNPKSIPIH